jgi:WD40 repeat protein
MAHNAFVNRIPYCILVLLFLASIKALAVAHPPRESLRVSKVVPLTGLIAGLVQITVDEQHSRALIAGTGDTAIAMIDLNTGEVVHRTGELRQPQGVAYSPRLNLLAVTDSAMGFVRLYDGNTLAFIRESAQHDTAHAVVFDSTGENLYLTHGHGTLSVIDPQTAKMKADVKLPELPESLVVEAKGPRIYVNIGAHGSVAVVDRQSLALVSTWSLPGAQSNRAIALDEDHSRLFVATLQPSRLFVLNTHDGSVVAKLTIMGECNSVHYDQANHRVYAVCGAGTIDVFDQVNADEYQLTDRIATSSGARVSYFWQAKSQLFVAVPAGRMNPSELRVYDAAPKPKESAASAESERKEDTTKQPE